jgi:hypothetical protein
LEFAQPLDAQRNIYNQRKNKTFPLLLRFAQPECSSPPRSKYFYSRRVVFDLATGMKWRRAAEN